MCKDNRKKADLKSLSEDRPLEPDFMVFMVAGYSFVLQFMCMINFKENLDCAKMQKCLMVWMKLSYCLNVDF